MQSRPASGASGHRSGVPNAMPGNSGGGGASAARRGSVALPALAVADGLRAKADLLERGLKNEELARNYMQLERVGAHARLRWPAASRPAWPSSDAAACDAHISCVCSHLDFTDIAKQGPLAGQDQGLLGHHQAGAGQCQD